MSRPKSKAQDVAEQAFLQVMLLLSHRLPLRRKAEAKALIKLLDKAYAQANFGYEIELPFGEYVHLDQADVLFAVRNYVANHIGENAISHKYFEEHIHELI